MSIVPLLFVLTLLLMIVFMGNALQLCRLARSGQSLPMGKLLIASICLSLLIICVWFCRSALSFGLILRNGDFLTTETALLLALVLGNGAGWLVLRLFSRLY